LPPVGEGNARIVGQLVVNGRLTKPRSRAGPRRTHPLDRLTNADSSSKISARGNVSGAQLIRVVSWNVLADAYVRREYYPNTSPEVLHRAKRRKAVAERIATFDDVEVLCLQEVDAALFALAEEKLPESIGRLFRKRGKGEGCAIFVRSAMSSNPEWRELVFSDLSGHVALGVTIGELTVVNTHLKWEPDGTPTDVHRGYIQLREVLDTWPSGPRVVCGDFNALPGSDVLALATSRGLLDGYASLPDAYTCNAENTKKRIDFILHTADFTATPSATPKIDDTTPLPSDVEPSDHVPIQVRLDRR
jgi:endonuclease/exonuclease/phosphatase family metal-dependent hydrolase